MSGVGDLDAIAAWMFWCLSACKMPLEWGNR